MLLRTAVTLTILAAAVMPAAALSVVKLEVLQPVADGSGLLAPRGLCRDGLRDMLVVADTEGDRVLLLDSQGGVRKVLGRESELRRPVAVAVTRDAVLYIAERERPALKVRRAYDSANPEEYEILDLAPHGGSRPVQPVALHAGADGNLYVVDAGNRQVLVLAADGSLRHSIRRLGEPVDVWGDSRTILAADPNLGRIHILSSADGKSRRTVGDNPSNWPQQLRAMSVTMDHRERIWTLDENGVIRVIDLLGNRLFVLPGDDLFAPTDLVVDPEGRLYVLERGGNQITVYEIIEF